MPRRLQENATSFSWPHPAQRSLRKPWARMPHSRKASNSSLTNWGKLAALPGLRTGEERFEILLHHAIHSRDLGVAAMLRALLGLLILLPTLAAAQDGMAKETLRGGWYLWDPYQFVEVRNSQPRLTGLDVELVRAITQKASYAVSYEEVAWRDHLEDLRAGRRDIAAGATFTAARAEFVHYSVPYRTETNVLYLAQGQSRRYAFRDVAGMLAMFAAENFRLGVIDGFIFADPKVNAYAADPANAARIIKVGNDYDNFRNLVDGRIDGFLADRIVAATTAWRGGWRDAAEEYPMRFSVPIHLVFSKASVPPETVAAFDAAILELRESGRFARIVSDYMFPVLLAQTLDRDWFFIIDVIGTVAFALSGVILAYRGRYALFGVLLLASLPAVGGGVVRDLIAGRTPIGIVRAPIYLLLIGGTVAAGYLAIKLVPILVGRSMRLREFAKGRGAKLANRLIETFDALGLAAFTVTGVVVAVAARLDPLWLWGPLLAATTGAGGGILRDIVRQDSNIATLKGELYAEIALLWGLLLSLFLVWQTRIIEPDQILVGIVATMAGAFLTRMAAVHLRIGSPLYH
jgi:polar amino acid transport system substrate-binding protein